MIDTKRIQLSKKPRVWGKKSQTNSNKQKITLGVLKFDKVELKANVLKGIFNDFIIISL